MSPVPKTFRSRLRERLEGVLLTLAAPVLYRASRRIAPHGRRSWSRALARWRRYARRGLGEYRDDWWLASQLESWGTTLRQFLLAEAAELAPDPAPGAGGTLVVAAGHLGDLLHTIPLLHALQAAEPQRPLAVAAGPWAREILDREGVAEVIEWRPQMMLHHRGNPRHAATWREELDALGRLRARGFDRVITTDACDPAKWALVRALRPAVWQGVAPAPGGFEPVPGHVASPHENGVYEALRIVRAAGLEPPGRTGPYALSWSAAAEATGQGRALLRARGVADGEPVAAVAPGAGWPGKQWPVGGYRELAAWLERDAGCRVVILGSKGERAMGDQIAAACRRAVNLCGETGLMESCGVLGCARLFVGNDSGLMHFAAVQRTPTVALFGPTPPVQWAPQGEWTRVLRATTGCPRCRPWHVRSKCEDPQPCMARIAAADVIRAAGDLLAAPDVKGLPT